MSWRLVEHTADVGIEVAASTLGELFVDAAAPCAMWSPRLRVVPRRALLGSGDGARPAVFAC